MQEEGLPLSSEGQAGRAIVHSSEALHLPMSTLQTLPSHKAGTVKISDERRFWLQSGQTRATLGMIGRRKLALADMLLAHCRNSTDPIIRAKVAEIDMLGVVEELFTEGTGENDE